MDERWDPNAQLICPYDPVHIISVKRYQHHIVKCRKNHPSKDFVPCPYNAKHVVLRHELKTHLAHCADRVILERDIVKDQCPETGEVLLLKGNTNMPNSNYHVPESNENWDDEIETNIYRKFEEQTIQSRSNYEASNQSLRRPNLSTTSSAETVSILTTGSSSERGDDDTASVTSHSSCASSLYVDPFKWNKTSVNNGVNEPQTSNKASGSTLNSNRNNSKPRSVGRGLLLQKLQNSISEMTKSQQNSTMQGVRNCGPANSKTYGRGNINNTSFGSNQW